MTLVPYYPYIRGGVYSGVIGKKRHGNVTVSRHPFFLDYLNPPHHKIDRQAAHHRQTGRQMQKKHRRGIQSQAVQ